VPFFQYTIRDARGELRSGACEADNPDVLNRRLREQGFDVQSVVMASGSARSTPRPARRHRRIRSKDRLIFWMQLSLLLDQDVPLLRALEVTAEQTTSDKLRRIVHEMMARMSAGETFFRALACHTDAFDSVAAGMIRISDVAGGGLPETVRRLVSYLEADSVRRRDSHQRLCVVAGLSVVLLLLCLCAMRLAH